MKINKKKLLLVVAASLLITGCNKSTISSLSGNTSSNPDESGTGKNKYTYRTYLSTKPSTWNIHTWETSDESYIPAFCEMGFYDLQLNDTKDGYEIITEMAAEMPEDVSDQAESSDIDMFGYEGNISTGQVWDIALNRKACWEDGTPIKADDYIESMKRQLDPKMSNFRADGYYSSSLVIANADRYFKQGKETLEEAYKYIDLGTGNWKEDNVGGSGYCYINLARGTSYVASIFSNVDEPESIWTLFNQTSGASDTVKLAIERVKDAVIYYCWKFEDHAGEYEKDWEEIVGYSKLSSVKEDMVNYDINIENFDTTEVYARPELTKTDESEKVRYKQADLKKDLHIIVNHFSRLTDNKWTWKCPLFVDVFNEYTQEWGDEPGATSGVGLVKIDDYKIRFYLKKQVTALDLKFSLSSNWLVNTALYDELKINNGGVVSTSYATPEKGVAGYKSYGPYKLTAMEAGKSFRIEKNDKWYGYTDGKHVGQYKMDAVYTRIITEHETVKNEFLAGKLDDIALTREDMKVFGNSSRLTRTFESYTQKISFNSDKNSLLKRQESANNNKVVLANTNFRKGLSLALDRNNFASQATSGSKPFTGLLNDLYLTEIETGEMYRNTPQGKSVYNKVYGELGGNPYDPNYKVSPLSEDLQGYNFNMATKFVADGLREELNSNEEGTLQKSKNAKISLEFRVYDDKSDTTIEMLNFITDQFNKVIAAAVEKLKEEGTLTGNQTIGFELKAQKDEDYYSSATKGIYDLIFSTWGGAAINPQGLMEVYCKADFSQTCEYGFKGKQDTVMIKIDANGDGKFDDNENKSFDKWYAELISIAETDERGTPEWTVKHERILNIMSGLEAGIINRFEAVPLIARATSSLNSLKIENGSPTYINLIGYGGIRHLEFNFTDEEWDAEVAKYLKDSGKSDLSDMYKN